MPNWNSILREISVEQGSSGSAYDRVRQKYLKQLVRHTGRNVIVYYSGFLSKPGIEGIQITDEDKNGFMLGIHGLDRSKGLDLILHTPGGDGKATEALVDYLRSMFGKNIRAIIPQLAMSAGTMIACSCKSIVMGKQSSLGPIDPQFGPIPAIGLLTEVERAYDEIMKDQRAALFWNPILSQIYPSFLQRCEEAVKSSNEFITKTLKENMFSEMSEDERNAKLVSAANLLSNVAKGKAHNTHFQIEECRNAGLKIESLEADQRLQDLVLTIHHCFMHTLSNTQAFKIIENQMGRAMVKMNVPSMAFQPIANAPTQPTPAATPPAPAPALAQAPE
jgi:ATP-dependent protease ClpP protease subunit